jgi:hypothetical protein
MKNAIERIEILRSDRNTAILFFLSFLTLKDLVGFLQEEGVFNLGRVLRQSILRSDGNAAIVVHITCPRSSIFLSFFLSSKLLH